MAADVGFEPTSCNLEDCRSRSAELIGFIICKGNGLPSPVSFKLVDVFGIAPNSSALQTDADLSQLNVLNFLRVLFVWRFDRARADKFPVGIDLE